jgi:hypothetical protein
MGMGFNPGMFMAGAGAIMNATGAYRSAAGQKAALQYQAGVADSNAEIAEEQARFATMNGQREEQAARLKMAAMLGDQKAALAANGVDVNAGGSAIELMATTKVIGEGDAFTIRDNAARMAWAYRQKARGYHNEAAMDISTADAMNPWMSGVGSLLASAGTVADKWYRYRDATSGRAYG